MAKGSNSKSCSILLNNEPVESLSRSVLNDMSQNLSRVISRYFMQHPDEFDLYVDSRQVIKKER